MGPMIRADSQARDHDEQRVFLGAILSYLINRLRPQVKADAYLFYSVLLADIFTRNFIFGTLFIYNDKLGVFFTPVRFW